MNPQFTLRTGTFSGAFLSILPTVLSHDILRTIVLGIVGTTVSFLVTLFLKWITQRRKK